MRKRKNLRLYYLAQIHQAKKALGLDDDCYRDVLVNNTGKDSCAAMTEKELKNVLRCFYIVYGYKPKEKAKEKPQIAKIKALLAAKGIKENIHVPISYAESILKRQCGVEKLEWASNQQLRAVITALVMAEKRREGKNK